MSDDVFIYTAVETLAVPPDRPPTGVRALASFHRLERKAKDPSFSFEPRSVEGCSRCHLDVHVHDAEGKPLEGVPVTLDFPEGSGREGSTDANGVAQFDDLHVDVTTLAVEVHRDWPDDADEPTYRARVIPAASPEPDDADEPTPPEDEPMLYFRPWDDPAEPDEAEDDDVPVRVVEL